MSMVTDVHIVCDDCGDTSFAIPNDFDWGQWADIERSYEPRLVEEDSSE
jgi:hypothetical protein